MSVTTREGLPGPPGLFYGGQRIVQVLLECLGRSEGQDDTSNRFAAHDFCWLNGRNDSERTRPCVGTKNLPMRLVDAPQLHHELIGVQHRRSEVRVIGRRWLLAFGRVGHSVSLACARRRSLPEPTAATSSTISRVSGADDVPVEMPATTLILPQPGLRRLTL